MSIASEVVTLEGEEGWLEILEGSRRERETHKSESERECDVLTGIKRKKLKLNKVLTYVGRTYSYTKISLNISVYSYSVIFFSV